MQAIEVAAVGDIEIACEWQSDRVVQFLFFQIFRHFSFLKII
jgi:hypothetical protein